MRPRSFRRLSGALVITFGFVIATSSARGQCLDWKDGIAFPGATATSDGPSSMVVFDDGTGPAVYSNHYPVIGGFADGVGRWDGASWAAVGGAFDQGIERLAVYDDGSGPALYAAGSFLNVGSNPCNRIARWDGSAWVPLGAGVGSPIYSMCAQQAGTAPGLYVGGSFSTAGGSTANRIARWDGSSWSAVGGGMDANVMILGTYDTPSGARVVASGPFNNVGGVAMSRIAQWDGTSWSPMTTGNGPTNVTSFCTWDFGTGPKLYMSGAFNAFGGVLHNNLAAWDGSSWSDVVGGLSGAASAIIPWNDGSGEALYFGGGFSHAGAIDVHGLARFDGSNWSDVGGGVATNAGIAQMVSLPDAGGPKLVAGGSFAQVGGGKPSLKLGVFGVPCLAPWFLHDPVDATAVFNLPIHFDATAAGLYPMTYQWRHNGMPVSNIPGRIEGATTPHMTIYLWSFSDSGSYDIVATDSIGSTASNPATLTVPAGGTSGLPITLTDVLRPPVAAVGLAAGEMMTGILDVVQSRTGEFVMLGSITGNHRGLFVWQSGTLTLVAREQEQAPGLAAGIRYHQFGEFRAADNGAFGFEVDLEGMGTSGPTGISRALYMHDSQGTTLVAALRDPAPGASPTAVFSNFILPITVGAGGQMAFCSQMNDAGVYSGNGLWFWDRVNGLVPVAIDGNATPVPGHTYHFQQDAGHIDPQGNITFEARMDDDNYALLHGVPGSLTSVLAFGDPMPGFPAGTVSLGGGETGVMNDNGDQVLTSATTDPGSPWGMYSWVNGVLALLLQKNDPAPGVPSSLTFAGAQPIAINSQGHVLFRGTLQGSCSGTCPTFGLWLWTPAGIVPICFNRGTTYPEIPAGWELDSFTAVALNDSDEVMLGARFYTGQYFTACYGWTQVSGLFPMAIPGTQVETDPGIFGTVSGAGALTSEGGGGADLFSSSFTGGNVGAFLISYTTVNGGLYRTQFNSLLGLYFPCPMVQGQPPAVSLVTSGQDVTLTASASGGGFLDYRWSHDAVDIFDDGRITGAGTDTLTIHSAISSDYGTYALRVSNICGLDESHPAWVEVGPGVAYCFGDGSSTACPCGNVSVPVPPSGCQNSLATGGALRGSGNASLAHDTLVLDARGMPNGAALFFQGTTQVNGGLGNVFGDGLRCAGGTIIRLATKTNSAGQSFYPSGEPAVSVKGNITLPGTVRSYQVWYRNAGSFCTTAPYNLTNGYVVTWMP